jgi:hypothetical protein
MNHGGHAEHGEEQSTEEKYDKSVGFFSVSSVISVVNALE